jgi:Abnormal spindle-like microcephaly-assoc'd, ASPM-SPD-2-Hydin/Immunoglobulin I-set domain/HYDIN/CFA65/VesB-like, Ig-like domain
MKAAMSVGGKILGAVLAVICLLAVSTPARAEVEVTVSPTVIDFGTQALGTGSAAVRVLLTNTGSRYARINGATVSGSQFSYSGPNRSFTLRPRQSLMVSISFRPNSAQDFSGTLTFASSNGGPITVFLSGTGAATASASGTSTNRFSTPGRRRGRSHGTASTGTASTSAAPVVALSITSQPANRTVTAGQTASFAVSVTGTAPFTYQWKKNGAAINGATSSSYTTPATVTSDNGAQFSCTVSNSAGSATSSAATLTVNAATLLLSANPGSLSFGNNNVGNIASHQVTLTNGGTGSITLSGVSTIGAGFSATGVFSGQILAPGQTVTVTVSFQPANAGSVTGSVTVASNASAPAVVTLSGSGVQPASHSVSLSWTRSTSTVNGYLVYISQVSGGPYTKLTNAVLSVPSYTDSSVQNGQTYYYVVTAVDANGAESSYSNQASAVIP